MNGLVIGGYKVKGREGECTDVPSLREEDAEEEEEEEDGGTYPAVGEVGC